MVSINPEVANCYKIFAFSSKYDPEAGSTGEQILMTILRRAEGKIMIKRIASPRQLTFIIKSEIRLYFRKINLEAGR